MSRRCKVHEFAELAGVTVKALRHYDRLGLLRPDRSEGGHRLYTAGDLERLERIVALKLIGVPLKEIREVLDRDRRPLIAVLQGQRAALSEQRERPSARG